MTSELSKFDKSIFVILDKSLNIFSHELTILFSLKTKVILFLFPLISQRKVSILQVDGELTDIEEGLMPL